MPALRGEKETLAVTMLEKRLRLKLTLYYTLYEEGLCRSVQLENEGDSSVFVDRLNAACYEFPYGEYDTVSLWGKPNMERRYSRERLGSGLKTLHSERGVSSHQVNCFMGLVKENTEEERGDAYGFNFVYSGNFHIECESEIDARVRVTVGERILYGGLELKAGERLFSPETVSVYSPNGIGGMSRNFHRLYRKYLINPTFADKRRPIVINSWESLVFNIGEEKLFEFIDGAKDLGIEMVVLDDGWFGERNNDDRSLGDWTINVEKLPNGLKPVIDKCHESGLRFGLWFEPESICPISKLYEAHPDWAIHTQGVEGVQYRSQFVLDFSKKEVVEYIFESMKKILDEYEIDYIKWDFNRYLTDVPNARTYHDFVLGTYALYEKLVAAYPNLLIEGCASGGGRFDPAILYYSPMIWTSDMTDAWERALIQYSTSLCYPLQSMSNHISRHEVIRRMSFKSRGDVAKFGCFGYELNIAKETEENRALVKRQTAEYKEDADLILTGDLYRLKNPYTEHAFSQMIVAEDKKSAILLYMRENKLEYAQTEILLKLHGLDENARYEVKETGRVYSAQQLLYSGLPIELKMGDYNSVVLHLERV